MDDHKKLANLSLLAYRNRPGICQCERSNRLDGLVCCLSALLHLVGLFFWMSMVIILYTNSPCRLKRCKNSLINEWQKYDRSNPNYEPYTVLRRLQPLPAIVAIAGCIVVIAFCSATWWDSKTTVSKVAVAYSAPIIFFALFVILKLINRRLWIRTSSRFTPLSKTIKTLEWYRTNNAVATGSLPNTAMADGSVSNNTLAVGLLVSSPPQAHLVPGGQSAQHSGNEAEGSAHSVVTGRSTPEIAHVSEVGEAR